MCGQGPRLEMAPWVGRGYNPARMRGGRPRPACLPGLVDPLDRCVGSFGMASVGDTVDLKIDMGALPLRQSTARRSAETVVIGLCRGARSRHGQDRSI